MNNEEKILQMLSSLTTTVNKMQSDIKDLKESQVTMQSTIEGLKENQVTMQSDIKEIKVKVTAIFDQTADLTEFRTKTNDTLDNIQNDVEYLTHKESQNEKTLFSLQRKISVSK